jgi:lipid A disaccharide synthetase
MKPKAFMLIAGEASGDLLAAELVSALGAQSSIVSPPSSPQFFGAGSFTNGRNGCKNEP